MTALPLLADLDELEPSRAAQPGDSPWVLGSYLVEGEIGRGGLGRVLLARHVHPQFAERQLAVKVLHPELARDQEANQRFVSEAGLLANLRHRNIVRTFEAGIDEGRTYIVMEYVPGCNLEQLLRLSRAAGRPLSREVVFHLMGELLAGLAFAHELRNDAGDLLRVVHHDLNPVNVLVSTRGEVKLVDFGIASWAAVREKRTEVLLGKVGRFAPEQLAGEPVDHRADVFGAGLILHELLVGRLPFAGASQEETMERNARAALPKEPFLPEADRVLEAVVRQALAREPRQRFASVRALLTALEPWRVETAVGQAATTLCVRALVGAVAGQPQPVGPERRAATPVTRVLLVTRDRQLAADLALRLTAWGMRVDVVGSGAAVGGLLRRYTCRAAIVDAGVLVGFEAAQAVQTLRTSPGMGQTPVVLLGCAAGSPRLQPANSLSLPHAATAAEIADSVEQLIAQGRGERACPRFEVCHPVSLRHQGRAHTALTRNISRTGLMVRCDCLPPRDELVHVTLTTSDGVLSISGVARVAHIEPREAEHLKFALGLEWVELNPSSEARLIELVTYSAAAASRRR